ncbi:MAG: hypothetical protein PHD70_03655 [Anaerostipes sp.]|nr:hypothetical protein [Anaerostipes sp.]
MDHSVSLSNINLFKVQDHLSGMIYCGSDQEWYSARRQRLTGCGPSTAANLLLYDNRKQDMSGEECDKKCLLSLMEEIWRFVTPKEDGIPSTNMFIAGMEVYAKKQDRVYRYFSINICENKERRKNISEVIDFIVSGIGQDKPIAFLNLCNGEVWNLERWHWVTIYSLEYNENKSEAWAYICDEGEAKKINLSLWLQTTTKGGGFLYFNDSNF